MTQSLLLLFYLFTMAALLAALFSKNPKIAVRLSRTSTLFPAVILVPLVIFIGMRIFGIHLRYPLEASTGESLGFTLLPASILLFSLDIPTSLAASIAADSKEWQQKTFYTLTRALGKDLRKAIFRVLFLRAVPAVLLPKLTLLFSELILVECIFAMPGVGFHAWTHARSRRFDILAVDALLLVAIWASIYGALYGFQKQLGKRLESYA